MERKFGEHTVRSFDGHLKNIADLILKMSDLTAQSIEIIKDSLLHKIDLSDKIKEHDKEVNLLEGEIENEVVTFIALRQPKAYDLRFLIAAIKVANNLERVGDYAKSVVKRLNRGGKISPAHNQYLLKMADISKSMTEDAAESFINNDLEKAGKVLDRDDEIDDIYKEIFNEFNKKELDETSRELVNVLFIAKSIERLADHAYNVASIVNYTVKGETIEKL